MKQSATRTQPIVTLRKLNIPFSSTVSGVGYPRRLSPRLLPHSGCCWLLSSRIPGPVSPINQSTSYCSEAVNYPMNLLPGTVPFRTVLPAESIARQHEFRVRKQYQPISVSIRAPAFHAREKVQKGCPGDKDGQNLYRDCEWRRRLKCRQPRRSGEPREIVAGSCPRGTRIRRHVAHHR